MISIAIIPARGGSKRLPNKNIKKLAGKPLISWTIESALKYGNFDLVIVSTDSQEIANVAISCGASVPFLRPEKFATDTATTDDVVTDVVQWVESNIDKVSRITLLQPTSPLRNADDIRNAMLDFDRKRASAIVSVCELEHPVQYCNYLSADLSMKGFIAPEHMKRSQEFGTYYRLNGAIYIFDRKYVGSLSDLYSEGTYAYIMDKERSVDIDDEFDFKMAEFLSQNLD